MGSSNTDALCIAGDKNPPAAVANVESWDGSSWTEVADVGTARYMHSSAGTTTVGLAFAGLTGPGAHIATTEVWALQQNVKVITD